MIFQYYNSNIKQPIPIGSLSVSRFVESIKNPKKETARIFNDIRKAEQDGNAKLKQELKSKLYYFTPCVIVQNSRRYANIKSFTGLLVLDFDHLQEDYAIEFKKALFENYKYIISCWLSASKHGVRALVKIPICKNVDEFKGYFNAIEQELGIYKGFDPAPKNCVLPLFMSYDPDLLQRDNYTTFDKQYFAPELPKVVPYVVNEKTSVIEKIIINNINQITTTGHIKLRSTAYALGGYIGAGYIDYGTAEKMLSQMIDCNSYLRQKARIYKKTAKEMIAKGINNPLYLTN